MSKLIYGDNLAEMRKLKSKTVDLICTGPPLHLGDDDDYDTPLTDMFTSSWKWNDAVDAEAKSIIEKAEVSETYLRLSNCLVGLNYILRDTPHGSNMMAYFTFLGLRFAEMHRLLAPSGSFYYIGFVVPHYVKCILDTLFGQAGQDEISNYKKEIILKKPEPRGTKDWKTMWCNNHSNILYYPKSDMKRPTFHHGEGPIGTVWDDESGSGIPPEDDTGYPTQQHDFIFARMIMASSRRGDTIMDPYCGSNPAGFVAQTNGRKWIGIDCNPAAITASIERMSHALDIQPTTHYEFVNEEQWDEDRKK